MREKKIQGLQGIARFPSANGFSPIKEKAPEIKWSEHRARNCQVFFHPAVLDEHSSHFPLLYFFGAGARRRKLCITVYY